MFQLNIQAHDEAIVAIAYDTRFVKFIVWKTFLRCIFGFNIVACKNTSKKIYE
jgi:hypothetical protein